MTYTILVHREIGIDASFPIVIILLKITAVLMLWVDIGLTLINTLLAMAILLMCLGHEHINSWSLIKMGEGVQTTYSNILHGWKWPNFVANLKSKAYLIISITLVQALS